MSKGQYNYYDPDYDLASSGSYDLLLMVNDASVSFMILLANSKKVLIWGEGYPHAELYEPVDLISVLGAKYADAKAVVPATSFTIIPKELFEEGDIPEYGKFLTVTPQDSILMNELDSSDHVLFKVPTSLINLLKNYVEVKSIFFSGKVLIAAIENGKPSNNSFYAHVEDNRLQLVYFKNSLLTFYNCFEFGNPDELMYFLVLTANELELNLDETSVIMSGDVNVSDRKVHRVSELLPKVNMNQTKIVSLPQGFLPHQILIISGPNVMRIIGGKLKGLRLNPPKDLPVRPTTDLAKEALFNILNNQIAFEDIDVLDLFSGTGNISLEFASRGARQVISVDRSIQCINYLKDAARQHKLEDIKTYKADVFKYLEMETEQYDLIFADPPYDLNRIPEIPKIVFEKQLLTADGFLVVEHQSMQNLSQHPAFVEQRKYGHSSFSFFKNSVS